uniref:Uncharacterized protein n=1 Tax=Glossina pallidipes TaxID=7398 RepID=A0A1A9ZDM0_GLOPL
MFQKCLHVYELSMHVSTGLYSFSSRRPMARRVSWCYKKKLIHIRFCIDLVISVSLLAYLSIPLAGSCGAVIVVKITHRPTPVLLDVRFHQLALHSQTTPQGCQLSFWQNVFYRFGDLFDYLDNGTE